MKASLVIMAAGMGSRFGGLKQMTPVGENGEMLLDYSVYDALQAGFDSVVFVIKREIEEDFRRLVGNRLARRVPVRYVFQELSDLPAGFSAPAGRVKPWGTGHAVWCCRGAVDGPFAVINADDFYGRDSFRLLHDFLSAPSGGGRLHLAMAGYILENTLTENGSVSRGVCDVDGRGMLRDIAERVRIEPRAGGPAYSEDGGVSWTPLDPAARVSMNCWAMPAGTPAHFERLFRNFLQAMPDPLKSEFYLPFAIHSLMKEGLADVRVISTPERWYGMTYPADRGSVTAALCEFAARGRYPSPLWRE